MRHYGWQRSQSGLGARMATKKLHLKTREAFADLSLHEKNAYLQEVADQIADARGDDRIALDKDALSRLRRYYSRRSMADLRLDDMGGPMAVSFRNIAESIRSDEVQKLVEHEIPATRSTRRVLQTRARRRSTTPSSCSSYPRFTTRR